MKQNNVWWFEAWKPSGYVLTDAGVLEHFTRAVLGHIAATPAEAKLKLSTKYPHITWGAGEGVPDICLIDTYPGTRTGKAYG